ncbi:MAG: DEAD/DEAH box helicase [Bacteroidota bacterium]
MTFEELGLKSEVLKSLQDMGFTAPTPIQEQAIPHLLGENSDLVGLAQTGTGKTAAFGLPLINNIENHAKRPQGLVICPTRELCLQITRDLTNFSKYLNINVVAVYGGADIRRQITDIRQGASIIVATPGRLMDLINRKAISLSEVEYVVLDEADEMLNMGFKEDIDAILSTTPETKNVWLFSATMPKEVAEIAKNYMHKPLEISIGHKNQSNENIEHLYYVVKERDRYEAVKRLIDFNPSIYGLIFCRTRQETASVAEKLAKEGYNAEPLHGDLTQAMRDRVMDRFRKRDLQILVATDVAARGIDIDSITHVINYNLPDDIENYTHRSGRTARAGKTGQSLVLINTKEQFKIKAIERQMRTSFTLGHVPNAEEICEIQLMKLINKIVSIEVKEDDIKKFLPSIYAGFETMSKEEVIKHFVYAEFYRFIDYYSHSSDLNASAGKGDRERGERGDREESFGEQRRERREDTNKTRFFVNLGRKDGLNPGGLLRLICDATGLKSTSVGRIDIMQAFAFFDADNEHVDNILKTVNGTSYEGNDVSIEVTKEKAPARNGGGGGNRRSGGDFGGSFKGKSDGRSGGRSSSYGKSGGSDYGSKSSGGGQYGKAGGREYGKSGGGDFGKRSSDAGKTGGLRTSDRSADRSSDKTGARKTFGKPFKKS